MLLHYNDFIMSEMAPQITNFMIVYTTVYLQYIPRNMHTVFALLCFVVVIH